MGSVLIWHTLPGLILVHDLTNRKSYSHLTKWLSEFHNRSKGEGLTGKGVGSASTPHNESAGYELWLLSGCGHWLLLLCSRNLEYDPEQFVDEEVPLLIVGTKPVGSHVTGNVSRVFMWLVMSVVMWVVMWLVMSVRVFMWLVMSVVMWVVMWLVMSVECSCDW